MTVAVVALVAVAVATLVLSSAGHPRTSHLAQTTTPLAVALPTTAPGGHGPGTGTPGSGTGEARCAATRASAINAELRAPVDDIVCTWQATDPVATLPIALSSPNVATVGGTPAVVVGDRGGDLLAYDLASGAPAWSQKVRITTPATPGRGVPIDATPSVDATSDVFVGAGNAAYPDIPGGGYYGFSPAGALVWHTSVQDPDTDTVPATGVQASLTVATLGGSPSVVAGSLDQEGYALTASTGAVEPGWPFFDSDSVFSTAAVADLYGTGTDEVIEGASQTAGFGNGQLYATGGHLRILSARGNLICHYDTTQSVNSSPAVGNFLPGASPGIVFGTGDTFPGAPQTDALIAVDSQCRPQWQTTLAGLTSSSPALADVEGTGALDVVEGVAVPGATPTAPPTGEVAVVDAATGAVQWSVALPAEVIGSVTTADLTGGSFQDLLVPTISGVDIVSGTPGDHAIVAVLDGPAAGLTSTASHRSRNDGLGPYDLGFQNSPLVTVDPDGEIGITVAGYGGSGQGTGSVTHFELPSSPGVDAAGPGTWPQFHHDPALTGDVGTASAVVTASSSTAACDVPSDASDGYELVGRDSGIFAFGSPFCGSTAVHPLDASIVGAATAPGTGGYWLVGADGGVFAYGGAGYYGSMSGQPHRAAIVGMAATPDGKGYWLVGADGGVFTFGDARFYGSMAGQRLSAPIVGIAATADGLGYRLVASDGGVFCFGQEAQFQYAGSMAGHHLNAPIVGIVTDQATGGYWLVGSDGAVFSFGAPFFGSAGGLKLSAPIVGIMATQNGGGYRLVAADGGVFAYGGAAYAGSMGGRPVNAPVVAITG